MPQELIIICIILVAILIAVEYMKMKKMPGQNSEPSEASELKEYPYKRKYLLTKNEYAFYKILKNKCDQNNILICPKVRLEDIVEVTTKENIIKYRGYIRSRHIDFLLCDEKLNVLCAVELDDNSHNTTKAKKTDTMKDNICKAAKLPLYRIKNIYGTYDAEIDKLIEAIKTPVESTTNS